MKTFQKKQIIIILIILLSSLSFVIVFGRYVTNSVNNFFLRSKEFYFYSDKLSEKRDVFQVDNWSGVDDYTIIVNMNSRKNNIQVASYDIAYDIKYTCSNNAICQLSKTSGIISKEDNTDSFNLTITPNTQLKTGDKVTVEVEATSKTSYKKTIKGKFTLVVGKENLTYQITDKPNNPYLDVRITNTLSYYIVKEAFGEYPEKYKIDIDTYLALSDENKAKCYSSIVRVEFDPREVLIDITNENYQKATEVTTTSIDGKTYINGFTLPIDSISSADLRFYKVDTSKDYTYPNFENESVVSVIPTN
jgi:hypothetical protein